MAHREVTGIEPKYLFFDEVQQAPEWSRFVRRLHNSGKYHIVVSGSSSRLLGREIATELRGRYRSLLMMYLASGVCKAPKILVPPDFKTFRAPDKTVTFPTSTSDFIEYIAVVRNLLL